MTTNNDESSWATLDPGVPRHGDGWTTAPEEGLLQVEVPISGFNGWFAVWVFEAYGVPRPIKVMVECRAEDRVGVINSKMLRQVSADQARERLVEIARSTEIESLFDTMFDRQKVLARPGRGGRDDTFYAAIAQDYVALLRERAPVKMLAKQLGYSASEVSNRLHEARRRGLLTASPEGRPGGGLTPKAIEILRAAREQASLGNHDGGIG